MKINQTTIFTSVSLLAFTLLSSGCAPKNADGTYTSKYSYHPYTQQQVKKRTIRIVSSNPRQQVHKKYRPKQMQRKQSIFSTPRIQQAKNNKFLKKPIPLTHLSTPKYKNIGNIGKNIETVAKSLLGTDYQYGATGPNQYDCSGFTKYVFSKQGINLPRVSRDQAKIGQFVNIEHLQKGDLIFFDSIKSANISHVGIYLGGGQFIHASSSKDQVTLSNLRTNYYSNHFKWGRRVTSRGYASR